MIVLGTIQKQKLIISDVISIIFGRIFLLLLFFPLMLSGQNYSVFDESGLASNNYFLIPEDIQTGDYVGRFYSWFHKDTTEAIVFSIQNNIGDIYEINPVSGIIQIANADQMPEIVQQDTLHYLVIKTQDGEKIDLDTAFIRIKENEYCKFIDPTSASGGNGKRSLPFNDWNNVKPLQHGYGYFQKRGTTNTGGSVVITGEATGTNLNPTCIGAYGSGERPIFDGTNYQYNYVKGIALASFSGSQKDSVDYVQIYEYKFKNWGGNGVYSMRYNQHIELNNCEFDSNGKYKYGPGIYFHGDYINRIPQYNYIRNCISHNNKEHGIKCEYTYNTSLINVWCYNNFSSTGHGIQLIGGQFNKVTGALLENNQNMGIRSRNSHDIYEYLNINCFPSGEHGIQIDTVVDWNARFKYGDYNRIRKFIITGARTGWTSSSGILLENTSKHTVIEDGEIFGNDLGLRMKGEAGYTTISRVHFHDNLSQAVRFENSGPYIDGHDSLHLDYCLIEENNEVFAYKSSKANGLRLDNCTFYNNALDVSGSSGVEIRNSIYGNVIGNFTGKSNYSLVEGTDPFIDATAGDFRLTNNTPAYRMAIDLGYLSDIRGYTIGVLHSVGAFDYFGNEITSGRNSLEDSDRIVFYPVPATDWLTIRNLPLKSQIYIYSMSGSLLLNRSAGNTATIEINLRKFLPGAYIVHVVSSHFMTREVFKISITQS